MMKKKHLILNYLLKVTLPFYLIHLTVPLQIEYFIMFNY